LTMSNPHRAEPLSLKACFLSIGSLNYQAAIFIAIPWSEPTYSVRF
jgi:hypothetical protein